MQARQETKESTPRELTWRDLIAERWERIQRSIADEEAELAGISDEGSRKALEQRLRALKLAAMSVWSDGKREGMALRTGQRPSRSEVRAGDEVA